MRTFTIALLLAPCKEGQVVDRAAWPAHITLVGNFRAHDAEALVSPVEHFAAMTPPVRVAVEGEAWFGPDRTLLVDLLEVPLLRALHVQLLDELKAEIPEFELLLPLHARDGYWPHRTVTAGRRPMRGEILESARVSVAELDPVGRAGTAVLLGIWTLDGRDEQSQAPEADR